MLRKIGCCIAAASLFVPALFAQKVSDPKASYVDVVRRHAALANNSDPRTASAIASLGFCTKMPVVQAPTGRMNIPHHYLNGSHGPTNPAEGAVTRVYSAYERRVTAGMNQWLVTSSKDEAQCATGVISSDNGLFDWGIGVYKQGVNEIDQRGAFPQEMARFERAIHYQAFALQPLVPLAEFAERQHVPLYEYKSPTGHTIQDAVNFLGAALANPEIIKAYTPVEQLLDDKGADFFSFAEFYSHHSAGKMPAAILKGLEKPTFATRIGGSTTVVDGYVAAAGGH
jgi:hypothetical protein